MNQTNNQTIVRGLLILGAAAIVYFLFFRNKAKAATAVTLAPAVTDQRKSKPVTVSERIVTGATANMATLGESEIKRYAGWIDRIIQILVQSRNERKNKYGIPTAEALNNADVLNSLSDANLRAVANYFRSVRGADALNTGLNMFLDESGTLVELTFRLDELGLRK